MRPRDKNDSSVLRGIFDAYERELLANTESRQALHLLAEIAKRSAISIGCFCADEHYCHRRLTIVLHD